MLIEKRARKEADFYPTVKAIYKEAFPKEERFPLAFFEYRAAKGKADFCTYWFGDTLVGFSYALKNETDVYVFYLAVKKEERGKGYGSEILDIIKEKYKDKVVCLDIEPVDENAENHGQRAARKLFYQKNGFTSQTERMEYAGVKYEIMSRGGTVTDRAFQTLLKSWLGGFLFPFFKVRIR